MSERTLFISALDFADPTEQEAFLAEACGDDLALRERVRRLLRSASDSSEFLQKPALSLADANDFAEPPEPVEEPGSRVGPYQLVQVLGSGGMGVVYLAEQFTPVRRRVALKIIKPGMDSRQVIARFEAERQALALMEHPNIARVLDAGATATGRPYFVMELVQGVPITQFADECRLTPQARLGLFVSVCEAVQHAHQKGIIHRDLKPSNVLVAPGDSRPTVKVIDFGVAKAIGQPLTETTLCTQFGQIMGTLEYMSPEQAELNAIDIDTRSDVYSLGVVLYELLTGGRPFEGRHLQEQPLDEALRIIREDDPPRPSTRLSCPNTPPMVAAQRRIEPRKLVRLVHGELDWIVMKALEKDRNRRYATASAFAQDIQHFLNNEPVSAGPATVGYRLRKFAHKHRRLLATAVAFVVLLLTVTGVSTWLAWRTAVGLEQLRAQVEKDKERETNTRDGREALQQARLLHEQARRSPLMERESWRAAMIAAQRARSVVDRGDCPEDLVSEVRELVARLETEDRDYQALQRIEALQVSQPPQGGRHASRNSYLRDVVDVGIAKVFHDLGVDVNALSPTDAATRLRSRPFSLHFAAALDEWALLRYAIGPNEPAWWQHPLILAREVDPEPLRDRIRTAILQMSAEDLRHVAEAADVKELGVPTIRLLTGTLLLQRQFGAVLPLLQRARDHAPGDYLLNYHLAICHWHLEPPQPDEVIRYCAAALSVRSDAAPAHASMGRALIAKGRAKEAVAAFRKAIALDPNNGEYQRDLGVAQLAQNLTDEALTSLPEALRLDPHDGETLYQLGRAHARKKRLDKAIEHYNQALQHKESLNNIPAVYQALATEYRAQEKMDLALAAYLQALQAKPDYTPSLNDLGTFYLKLGKENEAVEVLRRATTSTTDATPFYNLGRAYDTVCDVDKAIETFRQAIRLNNNLAQAYNLLGYNLWRKGGRDQEAEAAVRKALSLRSGHTPSHYHLGLVLRDQGRLVEARDAFRTAHELEMSADPVRYSKELRDCEGCCQREERLAEVIAGTWSPSTTDEKARFGQVALYKSHYEVAVRLFEAALAAESELSETQKNGYRSSAICAALRAAEASETNRSRYRSLALSWLQHELARHTARLDSGAPDAMRPAREAFRHWQYNACFAEVREAAVLRAMPAEEGKAWTIFWSNVQAQLERGLTGYKNGQS